MKLKLFRKVKGDKMEVLKMYPEDLSKTEQYKMMKSSQVQKMKEIKNEAVNVQAWILFTDEDFKTGESKEVLVIKTDTNMFGTVSETFIRDFKGIVDFFGVVDKIYIGAGKSKGDREFLICDVV